MTTQFHIGDVAVLTEPSRFAGTLVTIVAAYAPQIEGDGARLPYAVERYDMGLFTIGRMSVNRLAVAADGLRPVTVDEIERVREAAREVIEHAAAGGA